MIGCFFPFLAWEYLDILRLVIRFLNSSTEMEFDSPGPGRTRAIQPS